MSTHRTEEPLISEIAAGLNTAADEAAARQMEVWGWCVTCRRWFYCARDDQRRRCPVCLSSPGRVEDRSSLAAVMALGADSTQSDDDDEYAPAASTG